jgi:hypothetical protein
VSIEQITSNAFRNFIETLPSIHSKRVYKNNLKLFMQYKGVADYEQLLEGDPRVYSQPLWYALTHNHTQG